MVFVPNNVGEYVKQPRRWAASIGNGDASAWKLMYDASNAGAGSNGSKITGVQVTSNDTSARVVALAIAQMFSGATTPIASPGIVSWPGGFNAGNNAAVGDQVVFIPNGDTLPTGLAFNTNYFIISAGFTYGTSFELSATAGGSVINFTGSTSGTHLLALIRPIGSVTVPITAGTDGVTAVADLTSLNSALPFDNDGEKYLYLEANDWLAVSAASTVSANKILSVYAFGGDF